MKSYPEFIEERSKSEKRELKKRCKRCARHLCRADELEDYRR